MGANFSPRRKEYVYNYVQTNHGKIKQVEIMRALNISPSTLRTICKKLGCKKLKETGFAKKRVAGREFFSWKEYNSYENLFIG